MGAATARRRSRLGLAMRLAVAVALAAWFGRYAYLRLTVMPPGRADNLYADGATPTEAEAGDATDELAAIYAVLAQPPRLVLPNPPAGYAWASYDSWRGQSYSYPSGVAPPPGTPPWISGSTTPPALFALKPGTTMDTLDVGDAIKGEWTLATRPHLQAVVTWLTSQPIAGELDKLRRLRGRPYRFDNWASLEQPYPKVGLATFRQLVKALSAEARYQEAERGNLEAAWEDLKTGFWIGEELPPDAVVSLLVKLSCQSFCLGELQHMTLEDELSPELAGEMDRVLGDLAPATEGWRPAVTGDARLYQAVIDASFTRDTDGNGWLVLSEDARVRGVVFEGAVPRATRAGRVWDLASVFYNDRATVERKLRENTAATIGAGALDYRDAVHALGTCGGAGLSLNRLDGETLGMGWGSYTRAWKITVRQEAMRHATRVMIALNRFKAERGEYPEKLAELAPAYIAELPADPFGAASFGYRREAPDRYTLYSLGIDGEDDGGQPGHTDEGKPKQFSNDGDDIYTWPRAEPEWEPVLVPVQQPAGTSAEAAAAGAEDELEDGTEGAGDE